jgi:succinate-semialdehyde dehydrogenase/glutarate-semialdehyde dehydrogenase
LLPEKRKRLLKIFRKIMTAQNVSVLIEKSRKAQKEWTKFSYRDKARRIKKAARSLGSKRDEITAIIRRENGKLAVDALAAEVIPALMAVSYYIKLGRRIVKPQKLRGGSILMFNKISSLVYKPWGVVGIISPWNYPFSIPFSEVIMALLAGNGVILKTASVTTGCGRVIASILEAANLPEGLFALAELPGEEAGTAFINGGIDKLFFTGSTETGKKLMVLAAARLLPLCLELGGADAAIICRDADIDRAVWGIIWAGFSNAGQSCGGVQRILVHEDVYKVFLEKLVSRVEALRPGNNSSCDLGPLISLKQKKILRGQVEECIAGGAEVAAKSKPFTAEDGSRAGSLEDESLFAPAVILINVKTDMPVMSGEIFGPVTAVIPVKDEREALEMANASPFALTGSVWSANHRQAKRIAAEINAGSVMINDHLMSHGLAQTPWGGFGDSGFGKTHGEAGFREMLKAQVIIDDILPLTKRDPWWQPYSQKVYNGLCSLFDFMGAGGIGKRIQAIPGLIGFLLRCWNKNGK